MTETERLNAKIEWLHSELYACANELCLRCGDYKEEYRGACDGCRWKEAKHRDYGRDQEE